MPIELARWYETSWISGPRHVLLGVRFGESTAGGSVEIHRLPPIGHCSHAPLDERKLLDELCTVLRAYNARCGTSYALTGVRYAVNDTTGHRIALKELLSEAT